MIEEFDKIYYYRGIAQLHIGYIEDAIDNFDIAININPNNPDYYSKKADAEESRGTYKKAIRYREIAANIDNGEFFEQEEKRGLSQNIIDDCLKIADLFEISDMA